MLTVLLYVRYVGRYVYTHSAGKLYTHIHRSYITIAPGIRREVKEELLNADIYKTDPWTSSVSR